MQLKKYLMKLTTLLIISLYLSGCSFLTPKVVSVPTIIKQPVLIVPHPKKTEMSDVHFYVVTQDNFEEFKSNFLKSNSEFAIVAISLKDYENLSINFNELVRYIKQQKEIILYYEKAVNTNEKNQRIIQ